MEGFDNIEPSAPVHQLLIAIIVIVSIVATVYLDTLLLGDDYFEDEKFTLRTINPTMFTIRLCYHF